MDRLKAPTIRTPLTEGNGAPSATAKTAKEWYLHWQQATELANNHSDSISVLDLAVKDLTGEIAELTDEVTSLEDSAVSGRANLVNPGRLTKVSAAGIIDESAVTDDGATVTSTRTLRASVGDTAGLWSQCTGAPGVGAGVYAMVTQTPTAADQRFGLHIFGGTLDLVHRNSASVEAFTSEAWVSGVQHGSYLLLRTTSPGAAARATRLKIDHNGIDVTGEIRVAGTKVVGARGAGLTAAGVTVGAAPAAYSQVFEQTLVTAINNLITRLNELQARLQAHGLIA